MRLCVEEKYQMDKSRWQKIDALFDEYLDTSPELQKNFLDEKCEDAKIRRELEKLISALNKTDDFIENSGFSSVKQVLENEEIADDVIGKQIGNYRLQKLLGRGGMGIVYLATRTDDFDKEVAIKLIPPFSGKSNADNFRRERQILAKLEHENIARIFDGGTTDDKIPFLVMEYVDGLPLNKFCETNSLTVNERLRLFLDVCRAVGFAHQNLIVHRDLKPTNILVTKNGTVKLLDFGIAKLLQTGDTDFSSEATLKGNAFTPEYASPEQINGEMITTSSDVYSLGVVFYELLTNKRPHDFRGKSLNEILRIITKEEPALPSKIQNSKLKIQNPDLDAIALKSLAKETKSRYPSVEEFSRDIRNFLNGFPISARPNTFFYQTQKYLRRHRLETAIVALMSAIICGWLATAIWQGSRAADLARENRRTAYAAEMILAANEYENSNLNRLKQIVEKYKPQEGKEDVRGFEWYFLNNLLNPPSKIASFAHPDEVWNAEFSPAGNLIASACNDNFARIFEVESGKMILQMPEQKGAWKVSFFPDGKKLAVSGSSNSNPTVKIYETTTGSEILALKGHEKRVRALDVAPDGKTVATGSADGTIRIWNAETGLEIKKFEFSKPEKSVEFQDVQFSKNGDKLAVLGFEVLAVFDTQTWQKTQAGVNNFKDKNVFLNGWKIVFSPLEKTLAIGTFSGDVIFADAETLTLLKVLKIHQSNIKSLAFSGDGKILATGSWDRTAKFIDVQKGEVINELRGHFAGIHEIAISPDGKKFATASADFSLNLWDTAQVSNANAILTNAQYSVFSPNAESLFVWSNSDRNIGKWNIAEKKNVGVAKTDVNAFTMDFSATANRLAFGEKEGFITMLEPIAGTLIKRVSTSQTSVFAIKFSPDGKRLFAGYESGILKCFDGEILTEIFSIQAHSDIIKALDVSPDGKFVVTGSNDKLVKIFDAETGKEVLTLLGNTKPLYKTVFSSAGKLLVTTGADDIARIWQVSDGKLLREFSGMSAGVFAVAFSPDNKRLATASDVGVIRLWNIETGEQVLAFTASERQIVNLKFSADGKLLISVDSTGKVGFWQG